MVAYKIKYKGFISSLYIPEKSSGKTVLLLPGLPISSNIDKLVQCFLDEGCSVFYPQLSGSFDSTGEFDGFKHIEDIKDLIKMVKQGDYKELYFGETIEVNKDNEIILAGMSYSGVIALLGETKEVSKVLLLSPVLLYNQKDISKIVDFEFKSQMKSLVSLLARAFAQTYRISSPEIIKKFLYGEDEQLRMKTVLEKLEKIQKPVLTIHGKNDVSVPYQIAEFLSKESKNEKVDYHIGEFGHSNSSYTDEAIGKIKRFL